MYTNLNITAPNLDIIVVFLIKARMKRNHDIEEIRQTHNIMNKKLSSSANKKPSNKDSLCSCTFMISALFCGLSCIILVCSVLLSPHVDSEGKYFRFITTVLVMMYSALSTSFSLRLSVLVSCDLGKRNEITSGLYET